MYKISDQNANIFQKKKKLKYEKYAKIDQF